MSDPVTSLGGAAFNGLVYIAEAPSQGMVTLRGDLSDAALKKSVSDLAGCAMPDMRGVTGGGDRFVLWMAPDELLILLPYEAVPDALDRLAKGLTNTHHLAVDVSDARTLFTIEDPVTDGAAAREVLAKLTPADLHPDSFGNGELRRTRLAQVPAAFWMDDAGSFRVICFRSVAAYVFGLLSNAADPASRVEVF